MEKENKTNIASLGFFKKLKTTIGSFKLEGGDFGSRSPEVYFRTDVGEHL